MKIKLLPLAVSVGLSVLPSVVFASEAAEPASKSVAFTDPLSGIDFFGYFRSGIAGGESGSMNEAVGGSFQKNKLGRLGNEFDTYAEIGFGKELYNAGSQSVYIQTMINMYDGDSNSNNGDNPFGWENLNMQFRNFMGFDETTWVGIRQYNKYSIDANDYFFWNKTNVGGGIEKMSVGQGKLSIAALHRDIEEDNSMGADGDLDSVDIDDLVDSNQLELMYDSQPLWRGASLVVGYKYLNADASDEQIQHNNHDYSDGQTAMVMLQQQVFEKGINNTVVQYYADGSALQGVTFGAADTLNGTVKSGNGWAMRNYGVIPLAEDWDLSHAINYAAANDIERWDGKKGDGTTVSASAKVTYHWSDYTRTYVELGYFDDEKTVDGTNYERSGSKYTVAQALSFGRDKPELRLFASYFDSSTDNWDDTGNAFENGHSSDTWAVGLQANVFW
ncbi:carbohydrate porin [Buttiauxella sp. 3AFRM03]|uniref:carbohydrate porin n=1 Tax=Buttiauxella sp. 3AFRM03 TaxID=2479367 RepID=UPI000EF7DAE5|nr:carbohydrate porin [Buttiauxella sp. 3AFRM03]AYN26160.1 carbohydrate porin [Buttiauxella sp. 3AFRM03]